MSEWKIVDTFPHFQALWQEIQQAPVETQVERWASSYMARWPELLRVQQEDYAGQGEDWHRIAQERIFPFMASRLPDMQTARLNLLALWPTLALRASEKLGFESDLVCVIYVGIGCGAGWATTFEGTPAVLFGLENIAECGWTQTQGISGLIAHEIGHVAHTCWRAGRCLANGSGPWWQLYEEGFAQRCEHRILGRESWHMQSGGNGDGWLAWCQENQAWLARKFLCLVDTEEPVRSFFGSWFDIHGYSQTGYFLGHELVRCLERDLSLAQIALLQEDDPRLRHVLEALAGSGSWPPSTRPDPLDGQG